MYFQKTMHNNRRRPLATLPYRGFGPIGEQMQQNASYKHTFFSTHENSYMTTQNYSKAAEDEAYKYFVIAISRNSSSE